MVVQGLVCMYIETSDKLKMGDRMGMVGDALFCFWTSVYGLAN